MSINATNNSKPRELIPAGNYIARCYKMIEIGTVVENIKGVDQTMAKVRIGWELPTETKVFDEAKGPQPLVIDKEYTLSTGEKANLRKMIDSWRGKGLTNDEAKKFDISKLLGVPCMLNIIHKTSKSDTSKVYQDISSVTPMPKGVVCPDQINPTFVLSYDNWDKAKFDTLPDFIREKMMTSLEFEAIINPAVEVNKDRDIINNRPQMTAPVSVDDLPF